MPWLSIGPSPKPSYVLLMAESALEHQYFDTSPVAKLHTPTLLSSNRPVVASLRNCLANSGFLSASLVATPH